MKKKILFYLDLIEKQISDWKEEQDSCNEGPILDNEYYRLKILIWKIAEELEQGCK